MSDVKWQRKIPHLDEVEEKGDLFDGPIEASEKIDGQNLSFGVDGDGEFFTKTKRGTPAYQVSAHQEVPYLEGFERFHESLEAVSPEDWAPTDTEFQVFGELVPYPHTNTVRYDEDFFGEDGAVVLFDVFIGGERPERYLQVLEKVSEALTENTNFNVLRKNTRILEIEDFSGKADLLESLQSESILGADEPEGYVIRNLSNDSMAKVVDKSRFTEENQEMHRFSSMMEGANRDLKVKVRQSVFDNADVLTNKSKTKEKVVEELAARRQGGFEDSDEIFEAILEDLDSEDHVKTYSECLQIYTSCVAEWIEKATRAKLNFNDADADVMGQVPTVVAEHKIREGWSRIMKLTERFMIEESLVPLVKIALGPTRVHWLQDEFLN